MQWPDPVNLGNNAEVHELASVLNSMNPNPWMQVVPAYNSLLVQARPDVIMQYPGYHAMHQLLVETVEHIAMQSRAYGHAKQAGVIKEEERPIVDIPVCFAQDLGTDMEDVTRRTALTASEVVELFTSIEYFIYMLGFLPGFAYMGSLPLPLQLPRKAKPVATRAGAVAIAGSQAGIYPLNSPGGWHVLGFTPLKLFDSNKDTPCLLQPGMQVRFKPISLHEYLNRVSNGH